MKELSAMYTVAEVETLIDEICRHLPELRAKAESGTWTTEERATNSKLDAVCKALERRTVLKE